jgi:hypothetical protein
MQKQSTVPVEEESRPDSAGLLEMGERLHKQTERQGAAALCWVV